MSFTEQEKSMQDLAKSTSEVLDLEEHQVSVLKSAFNVAYSLGMAQNAQEVKERVRNESFEPPENGTRFK